MTEKLKFKGWRKGQPCIVSYKGIRNGIWEGYKGGCAFVTFDNGEGVARCHRVFSSTVKAVEEKTQPKKTQPKKAQPQKAELKQLVFCFCHSFSGDII